MEALRLYLCGRTQLEAGTRLLNDRTIGGPQARLVLAYLALNQREPAPSADIADALWGEQLPPSWDVSLSAIVSNLRGVLSRCGMQREEAIPRVGGCYQLNLPAWGWVDWHAATSALDYAEGALRQGLPRAAWGWAGVVTAVHRRPFLQGISNDWVESQRQRQRSLLLRGLDCFVDICSAIGEPGLALKAADEAVQIEPYREAAHARLMRLHLDQGNRAEALRVYERCRRLLADELGVDPSSQLRALHLQALMD